MTGKLFGKYSYDGITINDPSMANYVSLKPVTVPHTFARHANKQFAKKKVNMTKIESRPSKKKLWEVVFFVEIEGHAEDKKLNSALKQVDELCDLLKILGSYPEKMTISD